MISQLFTGAAMLAIVLLAETKNIQGVQALAWMVFISCVISVLKRD